MNAEREERRGCGCMDGVEEVRRLCLAAVETRRASMMMRGAAVGENPRYGKNEERAAELHEQANAQYRGGRVDEAAAVYSQALRFAASASRVSTLLSNRAQVALNKHKKMASRRLLACALHDAQLAVRVDSSNAKARQRVAWALEQAASTQSEEEDVSLTWMGSHRGSLNGRTVNVNVADDDSGTVYRVGEKRTVVAVDDDGVKPLTCLWTEHALTAVPALDVLSFVIPPSLLFVNVLTPHPTSSALMFCSQWCAEEAARGGEDVALARLVHSDQLELWVEDTNHYFATFIAMVAPQQPEIFDRVRSLCLNFDVMPREVLGDVIRKGCLSADLFCVERSEDALVEFCFRVVIAYAAVRSNAIVVATDEENRPHVIRGSALFLQVSRVNHSCRPNARVLFGLPSANTFEQTETTDAQIPLQRVSMRAVRVISTVHVSNGEEVTISYGAHVARQPRTERQRELLDRHFFLCRCLSCASPCYTVPGEDVLICEQCRNEMKVTVDQLSGLLADPVCSSCGCSMERSVLIGRVRESLDTRKTADERLEQLEKFVCPTARILARVLHEVATDASARGDLPLGLRAFQRSLDILQRMYMPHDIECGREMLRILQVSIRMSDTTRRRTEDLMSLCDRTCEILAQCDKHDPDRIESLAILARLSKTGRR